MGIRGRKEASAFSSRPAASGTEFLYESVENPKILVPFDPTPELSNKPQELCPPVKEWLLITVAYTKKNECLISGVPRRRGGKCLARKSSLFCKDNLKCRRDDCGNIS